jgi:Mce-associated membrane protein
VLGVSRDAGTDEIKAAWRTATDKFEPGSGAGQFRMFNEAADVLLDPERRRAYDASLDTGHAGEPEATAPPPPRVPGAPEEPTSEPTSTVGAGRPRRSRLPRVPGVGRIRREPAAGGEVVTDPASRTAVIVALVLALLTVAALATAGYFGLQVRREARVAEAREQAPAAAERATKAILSYDYRRLATDRKRAQTYLTDDYAKEYDKTFSLLEKQKDGTDGAAVQTKTVVTASVMGSAVVDAEDGVARVLVFVNQVSKRPDRDPQVFQNRVTVKMEQHENRWLVDDLKSY